MKKISIYLAVLLTLAMLLTGCGKGPESTPTPSTPAETKTPVALSTDIPDIRIDPEEYMSATNHGMAEDEHNIYLQEVPEEGSLRLYAISKATGEIKRLIDNCYNFTYDSGSIYWIGHDPLGNTSRTINRYDIQTGENKPIATLENDAFGLAADENGLYLIHATGVNAHGDPFTALYTMGKDGSGLAEAMNNVFEAGLYKGKIYFTTNGEDGSTIHEYDPETKAKRQLTGASAAGFYFEVSRGKVFFAGMEPGAQEGLCMVDTASGGAQRFQDDATQEFTVLGQYFLYIAVDGSDFVLTAYDMATGKSYKVADVTGMVMEESAYVSLRATGQNAYLNLQNVDGTFTLYRIVIEGGQGKLVKVTK